MLKFERTARQAPSPLPNTSGSVGSGPGFFPQGCQDREAWGQRQAGSSHRGATVLGSGRGGPASLGQGSSGVGEKVGRGALGTARPMSAGRGGARARAVGSGRNELGNRASFCSPPPGPARAAGATWPRPAPFAGWGRGGGPRGGARPRRPPGGRRLAHSAPCPRRGSMGPAALVCAFLLAACCCGRRAAGEPGPRRGPRGGRGPRSSGGGGAGAPRAQPAASHSSAPGARVGGGGRR